MPLLRTTLVALCTALPLLAAAQSVSLNGVLGNKALLTVDGAFPKSVNVGETYKGVKVLSAQDDKAVVEVSGKRINLRVGDAPSSVGSTSGQESAGGARVVLTAGPGGHFMSEGKINGRIVQFMVDTGATSVAMSVSEAERIGLRYQGGQPMQVGTANGVTRGWRITLDSVRLGDVMVTGVDAIVTPSSMPYVLLGNSFLSRFQMTRNNDQMTLERRF